MSDLIERKTALEALKYYKHLEAYDVIRDAPAVDAVHGEWVETEEDWRHQMAWWECSECGFPVSRTYNYCPHCGAKMEGERKESE